MKAHPIVGGTPLLLGDRVTANKGSEYYERTGEVTDIRVRCWGNLEEDVFMGKPTGRPMEQVWISLDNLNYIYREEDLTRA